MNPTTVIMASDAKPDPPVEVTCSNCGAPIGCYIPVGNQVWLRIGNIEQKSTHGRCSQCHTEFHWAATDKMLQDLLDRRKRQLP